MSAIATRNQIVRNNPEAEITITAKQWNELHRDYKLIVKRSGEWVRVAMWGECSLREVYIPDVKNVHNCEFFDSGRF